jgi:alternative ribosome-rescue factor
MVIKSNKKNPLINKLFSKKYKPRIVKSKKGKGSFKRLKNIKDSYYLISTLKLITTLS